MARLELTQNFEEWRCILCNTCHNRNEMNWRHSIELTQPQKLRRAAVRLLSDPQGCCTRGASLGRKHATTCHRDTCHVRTTGVRCRLGGRTLGPCQTVDMQERSQNERQVQFRSSAVVVRRDPRLEHLAC